MSDHAGNSHDHRKRKRKEAEKGGKRNAWNEIGRRECFNVISEGNVRMRFRNAWKVDGEGALLLRRRKFKVGQATS